MNHNLKNKHQKVKIGRTFSEEKLITCGVPQGSVLDPILFLIYINDIKQSSEILQFHDDTSTLFCHEDPKAIEAIYNVELDKVSNWLFANKLSLNVSKSMLLFSTLSVKRSKVNITLQIDNEIISETSFTKYLGVLVDSKLSWSQHIHHISLKMSKGIGILCKLRHLVSQHMLRSLYFIFIQPHIDYGLIIWGCATKSSLDFIFIQPHIDYGLIICGCATKSSLEAVRKNAKRAVRLMSFQKRSCHAQPFVEKLRILDFHKFYEFTIGKFRQTLVLMF